MIYKLLNITCKIFDKINIMKYIAPSFAFWSIKCSYDETLPYLKYTTRTENNIEYIVPLRHYFKDETLPTMLICNGCYEDIGWTDPEQLYKDFNTNICMFEYSGYGMHTYKISSESNCYKDVIAVYEYLTKTTNNIIIYGRSLGTGTACYLASYLCQNNLQLPNKLILVSPFISLLQCYFEIYVDTDIFRNYEYAPNITIPTLIIHGNHDYVTSYSLSVKLSKLFNNLYKFVTLKGRGHNDFRCDKYYNSIKKFILNAVDIDIK